MQTKWVFSTTFLPYTGEPIEFLLEDRKQSIHGTFANGIFHSRWADYDADRVQSWRGAGGDPAAEAIAIPEVARAGTFMTTLKRLTKVLSRNRNAAPIQLVCNPPETIAIPVISMRSASARKRHADSNQASS